MNTLVIIPAFNESPKIQSVVFSVIERGYAVLVVDDGSSDTTSQEAKKGGAHVATHFINRGYGAALTTGHAYALKHGYDVGVHFDADGQHNPDEIEALIKPIAEGKADFTIGSRFLKTDATIQMDTNNTNKKIESNVPLIRSFLIKIAVTFTWFISGVILTDAHNGFRALSKRAMKEIDCRQDGMSYASEIIDQVGAHKMTFVEVPNSIVYTNYSKSKGEGNIKKILVGVRFLWNKLIG